MIQRVQPDEIYNLAAQSFVRTSFDHPIYTADIDALGPVRFLEVIRTINPAIRFYQASTSEMYGKVAETPQSEHTPFHPRSPYAVSKPTPIGSQSTIARATACTPVAAFCSTTSRRCAGASS